MMVVYFKYMFLGIQILLGTRVTGPHKIKHTITVILTDSGNHNLLLGKYAPSVPSKYV